MSNGPNDQPPPLPPPLPIGTGGREERPARWRISWPFVEGILLAPFGLGAIGTFVAGLASATGGSGLAPVLGLLAGLVWVIYVARKGVGPSRQVALGVLAGVLLMILLAGACFVVVIIAVSHGEY